MNTGNTPLVECSHPEFPGIRIRIKDESCNEACGTFKDRKSALAVRTALDEGIQTLAVITSGNAGCSLGRIARDTSLRIVAVISPALSASERSRLLEAGTELHEADLSVEHSLGDVENMVRAREGEKILDITFGQFDQAYFGIVNELPTRAADAVIVPAGTCELFTTLSAGCHHRWPGIRCIGVSPVSVQSKADKLCGEPTYLKRHYRHIKPHTGEWIELTEEEIDWCIEHAPAGLRMEPSALTVFGALRQLRQELKDVILINTGCGF